jgi:tRNA A-37 threonylcarbamoyl transferase component Bud32
MRKEVVHPDYAGMSEWVHRLPECFEQEGEMIHDGRNKVKRFVVNGTPLIVKRYKRPTIFQQITYACFRPSKAVRAYLFAGMLRDRGFDTPHEVAYVEEYRHGLYQGGLFVSTECTDASVQDYLEEQRDPLMMFQLAGLLVELHQQGVLHGDLNLSNVLYRSLGADRYHFTLIDTNRSVFKQPTQAEALRNLMRVSHHMDILRMVVADYAEQRGWSVQESVDEVLKLRDRFDHRVQLRRALKKFFHL